MFSFKDFALLKLADPDAETFASLSIHRPAAERSVLTLVPHTHKSGSICGSDSYSYDFPDWVNVVRFP